MSMWTRILVAAVLAVLAIAPNVRASQPGVLTTGDNLPANFDPHQTDGEHRVACLRWREIAAAPPAGPPHDSPVVIARESGRSSTR